MTRRQKDPLRPLTPEERRWLARVARSHAESASHVARAKALLAVADGKSYAAAAEHAHRSSGTGGLAVELFPRAWMAVGRIVISGT